jgi:hypothetical protein
VGKGGQTVSATEFAELTGVSRERLRTWERRFGFPQPHRIAHGPRRYALADAPRVAAVRRAAEEGTPLEQAIAAAIAAPIDVDLSPATLAAAVAAAPAHVLLVSGPEPLRIAYANGAASTTAVGATVGRRLDELPWFPGSELARTLRALFAGDRTARECQHPAWDGGGANERSLAYRLPASGAGDSPLVALVGLERAAQREARQEVSDLRRERARLIAREQRRDRWIGLTAMLAERFQREPGDAVLGLVTATMVRGLGAVDASVAVYRAGELALDRSTRAVLAPRTVTVTGYADLAGLMHAGRAGWLEAASARGFGVPAGLDALGVPIVVVGETLGLLLLVFDERGLLDEDAQRLLSVVSAGLGFLLLRDKLVASGQEPPREAGATR